jgi:hypothetical protein
MLSPADLIDLAESFAKRIPDGDAYLEERNTSWLAIGNGWLKIGDADQAVHALARLDHLRCQAKLRHAICLWVERHPDSKSAREILLSTTSEIDSWEDSLNRREIGELVGPVYSVSGLQRAIEFVDKLGGPFTAATALVRLAKLISDPNSRRMALEAAEHRAACVAGGDRDYALRWVLQGFRGAGLEADAERVWNSMNDKLENTDRTIQSADAVLEQAKQFLPEVPTDTPFARLQRFVDYKFNDLKVEFLTDTAVTGGVDHPEIEQVLHGDAFLRVEEPRAPSLEGDPSVLDEESFANFLFNRPVVKHPSDQELLDGSDCFEIDWVDRAGFIDRAATLFEGFAAVGSRFSMEQIEQGLWCLLGWRFSLPDLLWTTPVPVPVQQRCLRAMLVPFRDYYASIAEEYSGSSFFMWWDLILSGRRNTECTPANEGVVMDVLEDILTLPGDACHGAALHGLNHLHPNQRAAEIVKKYLNQHRVRLSPQQLQWIESCQLGEAL